jgi:superfamily II DNA/RNA helicase
LFALLVSAPGAIAQNERFLGIWELNLSKSSITRGAPPLSEMVVNVAEPGGFRSTLAVVTDRERPLKCLVFTATREMTTELARRLRTRNHEVVSLSSLLSQANRERALTAFRNGVFDVLVATDVAARGLDIDDIDLVVNFDVPMHAEEYVHRIGRTGRAHREGKALTNFNPGGIQTELQAFLNAEDDRRAAYSVVTGNPLVTGSGH